MTEDNEYCEKHCKGYRDTGGRCFADGRCDAYWEYQKQKETMKIEIEYNGAFAVCNIELMDEPGKMVNFNDADTKSQTYALSAFQTINEHWQRDQRLAWFKNHPVMHIKREVQIRQQNLNQIHELSKEGVIKEWSFDISRTPTISVTLNDNHTIVEDFGWLLQDTEGRWWGMDNGYYRMLKEYQKIKMED